MKFSTHLRRTLTSTSPLRRAAIELRRYGLRLSDYSKQELFPILLATGVDLQLQAFDKFLEQPERQDMWISAEAAEKREDLRKLRSFAFSAYAAGKIELALMTGRLMHIEAKYIGMRVTIDPKMRKEDSIKTAQQISAERRTALTAEKLTPAKYKDVVTNLLLQYKKAPTYRVAEELGVSQPTLRAWKIRQGISES